VPASTDQTRSALPPPWHTDLAAGDTELVQQLKLTPELRAGDLAAQQLAVSSNRLGGLVRRLVEEFDSEMAHAQGQHAGDIIRTRLRHGIEDGIAAAGIRLDRVLRPDPVAQL
jgi:hypothetical protein